MSSWFHIDHSENVLALHIDSGSVGVALMHCTKDLPSEIIYKTRVPFHSGERPTEKFLESAMIKALSSALEKVLKNALILLKEREFKTKVDRTIISLSSPWVVSNLKTSELKEEKRFVLDSKVIREAILQEEEIIKKESVSKSNEENEFFESAFVGLRVNGYQTNLPIKDKVNNAQIDFILNISKKKIIHRIEEEITKSFSVEEGISLQGFMFIYFKVLSHVFQTLHSSLLINITNEATEILFVEHNNPRLLTSLPMGPISLSRRIKDKLKIGLPLAESYLKLFVSGDLNSQTMSELTPIINDAKREWMEVWENKTDKFPNLAKSPYAVFLTSLPKHQSISKMFLENVLPNKNIIILGQDNKFTSEITKSPEGEAVDENLAITCFYDTI